MASESISPPNPASDSVSSAIPWLKRALTVIGVGALIAAALMIPSSRSNSGLGSVTTHKVVRSDLLVTVTEQGTLESANNTEIKCKVRGDNTIIWVVESGTQVEAGDELVRLDTLLIDEEISERTKFAHLSRSGAERAKADVARAKIAISEYLEGRFVSSLSALKKDLAVAESDLLSAKNMLTHSKMMAESEYASELEVEEREFALAQADLKVKLTKTQIEVLEKFTKAEELATLHGDLNAAKANYEAERERTYADEQRLARAKEELGQCTIRAERSGLVIYPTSKAWEQAPDIEEGATVHKDQVLLLMPDLNQMQVKVGVHESVVERVEPGLIANVNIAGKKLAAEVASVASVAKPAGWWTGNVVKYDTVVKLPETEGLKPGMSVEVEVILAKHENVLVVPTSAIISTADGHACWVNQNGQPQRRNVTIGDNSDMLIWIKEGVAEGEEVILDPLASVKEAQEEAAAEVEAEDAKEAMMSEI